MSSNAKKQKYIIESLLSSKDIFSRCVSIIQSNFFDKNYEQVVQFILDYYSTHNGVPKRRILDVEFDITFDKVKVTRDEIKYVCNEIEVFCKESAIKDAILASSKDIREENFGAILERVTKAISISLDHDLGVDFFENPEEYLKSIVDTQTYESTGIDAIDKHLGGGILRKQLTLFSANSGGGKSIMLNNIGATFAYNGHNVLYVSLELPEDMIYVRSSAIWANSNVKEWKSNIPEIAAKIEKGKEKGGSFRIKRMPQQSTVNDIRAYLKNYELEFDYVPDLIIIDYLDLMSPNGGSKGLQVFEKDKLVSEQVAELLHSFDMYGLSASQQNRDGIGNASPDQSIIAGGLSKINTTDNYISIYMDEAMRLVGKMMIFFLKTRSSDGVGKSEELEFNIQTLAITDVGKNSVFSIMPLPRSKRTVISNKVTIDGVPNDDESKLVIEKSEISDIVENINIFEEGKKKKKKKPKKTKKTKIKKTEKHTDGLLGLMSSMMDEE